MADYWFFFLVANKCLTARINLNRAKGIADFRGVMRSNNGQLPAFWCLEMNVRTRTSGMDFFK